MRRTLRPWRLRRYRSCTTAPAAAGVAAAEPLEARALLAAAPVAVPVGDEFPVNTHTAGSQELFAEAPHAVASDSAGNSVVVWSSSGQDGSAWGVYGQRFDPSGAKRGGEFRVNEATSNSQWYPTVASDADGDFVVTWTSYLQDGSQSGVYARQYTAAGAPRAAEFRVNTTAAGDQRQSSVSCDADGNFVVSWAGESQDGGGWDVYAQRYAASGAKRGGEFRVNGTSAGDQRYASVAVDADGDFVVAWTADGQDGSGTGVYARRYDDAGAPQGGEFRVNTFTAGNQQYGRVACDPAGNFVVAWASAGQDGAGRGVYAQRYTASGAKAGGEFRVSETTAGEQFAPTVAADAAGGFVVTWTGAEPDGAANGFGVYGRAYDAAGEPRGGEFLANSTSAGNQVFSSVATDAAGNFVVAWESDQQDGSFFGVYGRRFELAAPPSEVVGRHLFYNNSFFDGHPAGADAADDGAIAADKVAVPAGAIAPLSAANFSGYSQGINGIMVDIAGLGDGAGGGVPLLTAEDFEFTAGNASDPAGWAAAAAPSAVTVRPGAGVDGSDRVTLVWSDEEAVRNQWLRLTVRANGRTRLAAPDTFYFGNLVGDAGDGDGSAAVNTMDMLLARRAFTADPVPITDPFDFNRDGHVSRWDLLIVRRGLTERAPELVAPAEPGVLASATPPSVTGTGGSSAWLDDEGDVLARWADDE